MKFLLTIIFLSVSYCYSQAQIKYVKGISVTGKEANYVATALPMGTTTQTAIRHHSDSLKLVFTLFKRVTDLERTNKILRDSIKLFATLPKRMAVLEEADTLKVIGNGKVRQVRAHYSELEIFK